MMSKLYKHIQITVVNPTAFLLIVEWIHFLGLSIVFLLRCFSLIRLHCVQLFLKVIVRNPSRMGVASGCDCFER